ncbi:MAG: cytochrome c3 family protein [Planctomycetes bacterium]|nr:cytochrome c3 family protein [Planctomycetota bacterium]
MRTGGSMAGQWRIIATTTIAVALLSSSVTFAGAHNNRSPLSGATLTGPGVANHPVDVVPSEAIEIPTGWPLEADCTITCRTCHFDMPGGGGGIEPNLRDFDEDQENPTQFCVKCHAQAIEYGAAGVHWQAVGRAHIGAENAQSELRSSSRPGLDSYTRQCLGCHDGAVADDSLNQTPWNHSAGYAQRRQRNHPVGVEYPTRTPAGFDVPFLPISLLPVQVFLQDGKVGCLSCHDLYAGERYLLTVPIQGSELCLTCHDLR